LYIGDRSYINHYGRAAIRQLSLSFALPTAKLMQNHLVPLPPDSESNSPSQTALPLSFIPNVGQTDAEVAFNLRHDGVNIFFTPDEIVFNSINQLESETVSSTVEMQFLGANPNPEITGLQELEGVANFFYGNDPEKWLTNVPTYGGVVYQDLYPGIDLVYRGTAGNLKRDFIVDPGVDPNLIQIDYSGIENIEIDEEGDLILTTEYGEFIEDAPFSYQYIHGEIVEVESRYKLLDENRIGFELGAYNPAYAVAIDPVLEYSTYLGGMGDDGGSSIAVDNAGNAYITGATFSNDFPDTVGGNQGLDVFVAKLNPTGTGLLYSTYIGGSTIDAGTDITVDNLGNAYITGSTNSIDFPTLSAFQTAKAGGNSDANEVFITKLDNTGTLAYSTYLGGTSIDIGRGIVVDSNGDAYVTGETYSTDFNSANNTNNGAVDAFVARIKASGAVLAYSRYVGGQHIDEGQGIAINSNEEVYITGETYSTATDFNTDFPATSTGLQVNINQGDNTSNSDAFIVKLNTAGTNVEYGTYFGGSNTDEGYGIVVDDIGNIYIAGITGSGTTATLPLPTTAGVLQDTHGGGTFDVFVAKFNETGVTPVFSLDYSTYLGGMGNDNVRGPKSLAVDDSGNAYLTGYTRSNDFPLLPPTLTNSPIQQVFGGGDDGFIAQLNNDATALTYSTYLGGTNEDRAYAIALDSSGNAYVTGETSSSDFPVVPLSNLGLVTNALQTSNQFGIEGYDAFVSKIVTGSPEVQIRTDGDVTVDEDGTLTEEYEILLTTQPTADVTVQVASDTEVNATNSVTFTSANWFIPQTIAVTAVDDLVWEGSHTGTLTHSVTSTDTVYGDGGISITVDGTASSIINPSIVDNDLPPLIISEILYNPESTEDDWEWIEVYNNGTTPIDLSGFVLDDDDLGILAAANIASGTIAPGQTGILYNADDLTAAAFEAAWGNGLNLIPVTNWPALANNGDRIGLWDSLTSYNSRDFTTTTDEVNYDNVGPWPSLSGVGGPSIYLTDLSADNNTGGNWALNNIGTTSATGTAYESANLGGNNGLDIASPGSIDTTLPMANLTAADVTVAGGASYTFTVEYSDDRAIDVSNLDNNDIIVVTPTGANLAATLQSTTPTGNNTPITATYQIVPPGGTWDVTDNGTYTVQVEASEVTDTTGNALDAGSLGSFLVDTNTPPTANAIAEIVVDEDAANQAIDLFAAFDDVEDADPDLTYTIINNSNPLLFDTTNIDPTAGTLTLDFAADVSGSANLTLRGTDTGGKFVETTVAVTVNGVNDAPSFTPGVDLSIDEDAGSQTVTGWASAISTGGGSDEVSQNLTFNLTTDNDSLFATLPTIASDTGTLTYTPAANVSGTATVTVTLQDDGGTANGGEDTSTVRTFTIAIAPLNDAPILSNISLSGPEDTAISFSESDFTAAFSDTESDELSAISITALPSNGTLTLAGAQVTAGSAIARSDLAKLVFTPDADFNGTTSFSWNASDGKDFSDNHATVNLTVTPENDPPTVGAAIADRTAIVGDLVSFAIAATHFNDIDGDDLLYTATLNNGADLPIWLTFDPSSGTFSGTPDPADVGEFSIKITASDGLEAVSQTFGVTITPNSEEEDPVIEDPVIETPVNEDPVNEDPVIEDPVIEDPVNEDQVIEDPVIEDPVIQDPVIQDPVIQDPVIEDPVIETPVIEDPVNEDPVNEDPVIEDPVIEDPNTVDPPEIPIAPQNNPLVSDRCCDCEFSVEQTEFNAALSNIVPPIPNSTEADRLGNEQNNVILGSDRADGLFGFSGNDALFGRGNDDNLYGDEGDDILRGGRGSETPVGDTIDRDRLEGGSGDDILHGNEGNDTIYGGSGSDRAHGGKDDDLVFGDRGNDILWGDLGNDRIFGGVGSDRSPTDDGDRDLIFGNRGDDEIHGNQGRDSLYGGRDDDSIWGGKDGDLIWGDRGNDRLMGDNGDDTVFGGVSDSTVGDPDGRDWLFGGEGNDFLNGNESEDTLIGGNGDDTLHGGQNDDILAGNRGDDWLFGDFGADIFCGGDGSDRFVLHSSGGDRIVDFEDGIDRLVLSSGISFEMLAIVDSERGAIVRSGDRILVTLDNIEFGAIDRDDFEML
jgi:hypothetical protein